jgi:predicted GIY-YIG superfamily endonuclease
MADAKAIRYGKKRLGYMGNPQPSLCNRKNELLLHYYNGFVMPYPTQKRTPGPLIYLFTFPNGKHYIGQTMIPFEVRMTKHKSSAKNRLTGGCAALNAAINKYEWHNIKKEVLILCDEETIDMYEQKFIYQYDSMYPNGYNLDSGGSLRKYHSDVTRSKTSRQHLVNSVRKNPNKMSYGCIVPFKHRTGPCSDKTKINYAILDHPMCDLMIFQDYPSAKIELFKLNNTAAFLGISTDDYEYMWQHHNTHMEIKLCMFNIVQQIEVEHAKVDRWKRIKKYSTKPIPKLPPKRGSTKKVSTELTSIAQEGSTTRRQSEIE